MNGPQRPFRIEQAVPDSRISQVIEESLAEYQARVARVLPGAELSDDNRVLMVYL